MRDPGKVEPRPPFQAVQRIGRAIPGGFNAIEMDVLDWDDEWWMWTWEWRKLDVRQPKLLGPIT